MAIFKCFNRFLIICPLLLITAAICSIPNTASANKLPLITDVEQQPLIASVNRLIDALSMAGAPIAKDDLEALEKAMKIADPIASVKDIQTVLDKYVLAAVTINAESRVSVEEGPVNKELIEKGWRTFLIKVENLAHINPALKITSPNSLEVYKIGKYPRQRPLTDNPIAISEVDIKNRFLDLELIRRKPMKTRLSGLGLEYQILQLSSRDPGRKEAKLIFDVGQGTQDLGFRSEASILFHCKPAKKIPLIVRDQDNKPTTAAFVIRDQRGRIYPNPARRLAPDFFFHDQVYRKDGESISLPAGKYSITVTHGPEYIPQKINLTVENNQKAQTLATRLKRWIHPKERGWFSGDHHVHAAGCKHYDSPTEGVGPEAMLRHIVGEDLDIGCVLTWGPCWYTQKENFSGQIDKVSMPNNLIRYDVEVSGFPSSHAGHLCLLRLKEDDYPGAANLEEWPTWTLPVLKWGRSQGAVVGYSHSGWGLGLPDYKSNGQRLKPIPYPNRNKQIKGIAANKLPDYAVPPFDGIGANEYIVAAAHDVCDFISAVDTPSIWELNIWYHVLNCGFNTRISGETDFPCIYGERVGLGRSYIKLDPKKPLDFNAWVQGLKNGRSYCSDGLSHLFDFEINGQGVGEKNNQNQISQVNLKNPETVSVEFDVAALLEKTPTAQTEIIRNSRLDAKPYWHIERCRIGNTRTVPIEVIVNGKPAIRKEILADGKTRSMKLDLNIKQSSWVAVRILPSCHTNPIFIEVNNKPIRASKKSAKWCQQSVKTCWESKKGQIKKSELVAAKAAYDKAFSIYSEIEKQCSTK